MSKNILAMIARYATDEGFDEATCIKPVTNLHEEREHAFHLYRDFLDKTTDFSQHEEIFEVVERCVITAKECAYAEGFHAGIALVVEAMSRGRV